MKELLSRAELKDLTGAPASEWADILRQNGIPFVRRKDGTPAVTWTMVNQSQLGKAQATNKPSGFNLAAING